MAEGGRSIGITVDGFPEKTRQTNVEGLAATSPSPGFSGREEGLPTAHYERDSAFPAPKQALEFLPLLRLRYFKYLIRLHAGELLRHSTGPMNLDLFSDGGVAQAKMHSPIRR